MANNTNTQIVVDDFINAKKQSAFKDVVNRLFHHPEGMIGLIIFFLLVICAIFAPILAPYGVNEINVVNAFCKPCWEHLCGTDELGRDIFSRLIWGARYSLGLGVSAQALRTVLGIALGCVAGYFGGKADMLIMRFCDVWQSIPGQLMTVVLATVIGKGWGPTVLAMGLGGIPGCCRMIRGQLMSVREQEYVEAAIATNCKGFRIVLKYMLPNGIQPMIVSTMMGIGGVIGQAAGLAYLGLGVLPPMAEWGAMLNAGRNYVRSQPHMILFPGLALAIAILALNMFGDGLRDAMDPHMKK